ncbi:unnamed protein product, partial [Vitis vinifera]
MCGVLYLVFQCEINYVEIMFAYCFATSNVDHKCYPFFFFYIC